MLEEKIWDVWGGKRRGEKKRERNGLSEAAAFWMVVWLALLHGHCIMLAEPLFHSDVYGMIC